MNRTYKFPHNLAAPILLLSLCVQSCSNSFNPLIPLDEGVDLTPGSGKQILPKQLEGQELRIPGGNLITFYEQDGGLRADIKVDEMQPKPTYTNLPVVLEKRSALASLQSLDPTTQQQRIQFKSPQDDQPGYVKVFGGGLSGGMKRKSAEVEEVEKKEEKTDKIKMIKRQHLLIVENALEEASMLGNFQDLPLELLESILSYIEYPDILWCANINHTFYKFIKGFEEVGLIGLDFKPTPIFCLGGWIKNKMIDFQQAKFTQLKPETTRSIFFYQLLYKVQNLPQPFWFYLKGSNIQELNLRDNNIGDEEAAELAQYLPDTNIYALYLGWNQIGPTGVEKIAGCLPAQICMLELTSNQI